MTENQFSLNNQVIPSPARPPDARIFCFEQPEEESAFDIAVTKLMGFMQSRAREPFVSPQNVFRFNHGRQWVHSAREPEPQASMQSISSEWLIPFKDIAENDLSLISRSLLPVCEDMSGQFARHMYSVVSDAAGRAGNVVDAKAAGSMAASLIEMMTKIELGVDRDGNVRMPALHVSPEVYEKLVVAIESMKPEEAAEIERLKQEKSQQALSREAVRRAKFQTSRG